jgi:polar amino acid transport system substrate-binding protein
MKLFLCAWALAGLTGLNCQAQTSFATPGVPTAKVMRLATLEWQPYSGQLLPQDGLSTRITAVVAKAAGYRLLSASFEWAATVEKGEKDPNYEGYFPEYFSTEREQACHLSQSIGTSLLGVATLKNAPITWNTIPDLEPYKLGVVEGYVNGEAFDQAVKEKRQMVEAVSSDALNVKKLREGKIRGILIDKNVLSYTLSRLGGAEQVVFNPRPIAQLTLHVCFKRSPAGLEIRNAFDAALKKHDLVQLEAEYFRTFPLMR